MRILSIFLILSAVIFARDIDINKKLQQLDDTKKYLYVYLHRVGCGYCSSMEEFTLDDDLVKEYVAKKFMFVQINVSYDDTVYFKDFKGTSKEFAKHIGFNFYPSSLFFDKNGKMIEAKPGYVDEVPFLKYLKSIYGEK